ncbi:2-hydroxymuconate tautomerase family protein [Bacillus sp. RAR_GA_16]|uniref:2-hydroxymuconate tautomerase family protein n=1 Tax=Bacillus sp. RAR_GA_16 TaxID=2876774 RepID=UPI001CCE966A|nr:2-hydroxymuconate tautomerase family protein [Bacillus sp. RAR_GA_16]MCA0174584.1 2-hydroxymuconate tautomerase family protein [Bacillus sp. RAR_GA_16]
MPIAHIHILEGRGLETKRKLVSEVSYAISHSLDVEISKVRVLLHEIPEENWSVGGVSKADKNGSIK